MLAQGMYGVVKLARLPWMSCQGGTQDSERRLALLTRRHHITPDRGKDVPALFAPKTPGNLLFDLHHAECSLRGVVVKGNGDIVEKGPDFTPVGFQSGEQVLRQISFYAPTAPLIFTHREEISTTTGMSRAC